MWESRDAIGGQIPGDDRLRGAEGRSLCPRGAENAVLQEPALA